MSEKIGNIDIEQLERHIRRLTGKEYRKYWITKRIFDIILSVVSLVLLSPLLIFISLIIFLDDPHGGPIYKQTRIGRHGKPFTMLKFRSMYVNADRQLDSISSLNIADGPAFKAENDPRVTRFGHYIRRYCIDEIPQLLNILSGDMSFVGPRPPLPKEVENYTKFHLLRLAPTPGLTCYWQLSPNRHKMPFDDWVKLDIEYIQKRTMIVDIKLILFTIAKVFSPDPSE